MCRAASLLLIVAGWVAAQSVSLPGVARDGTSPTLAGKVTDDEHKPVAGAFVWLIRSEYHLGLLEYTSAGSAVTGGDGTYKFDAQVEPQRRYQLVVERDPPLDADDSQGAVPVSTFYGGSLTLDAAIPIVLDRAERREKVDIQVRRAVPHCVDGRTQLAGKPLTAQVRAQPLALATATGYLLSRFVTSDENGAFLICGLSPGEYRLSAGGQHSGSANVTIADGDVHRVTIDTDPASVHVEIRWDGDVPNDRAISVGLSRDRMKMKVSTRAATYSGLLGGLADLTAGDYAFDLSLPEGAYASQLTYNGAPVEGNPLHVAAGSSGTLLVVASQGSGAIDATVANHEDMPMANMTVVIVPSAATSAGQLASSAVKGQTDSAGAFHAVGLAPGRYRIVALPAPYRDIPEDLDRVLLALGGSALVEVEAKASVTVKLAPISLE